MSWIRRRPGALLCVVMAWAAGFVPASNAHAIPRPPPGPPPWLLVNADVPVAADGALLFRLGPAVTGAQLPVALSVMIGAAGNRTVPGAVEELGVASAQRYQVWRPESAFTVGEQYNWVDMQGLPTFFEGAPATTAAEPPPVELAAKLSIARVALAQVCCAPTISTASGFRPSYGTCLITQSEEQPELGLSAQWSESDASAARQFVYRLSIVEPATSENAMWWSAKELHAGITIRADREAGSYCYRLEAFGLIDRARFVIEETCIASDLRPFESPVPSDAEMKAALNVQACPQPPPEVASLWCEVNRELCADSQFSFSEQCAKSGYAARCSGTAGHGGLAGAGMAGAGMAGAGSATGSAGSGSSVPPENARYAKSGCSIAPRSDAVASDWLLACGVLLAIRAGTRGRGRRRS